MLISDIRRQFWIKQKKNKEKREEKRKEIKRWFFFFDLTIFFSVCSQRSEEICFVKENKKDTHTHTHWAAGAARPQTTSA